MKTRLKIVYNNVDEYIALQHDQIIVTLEKLRQAIKQAAPEAEEVISYQMPAYKFHGMLCYFATFQDHYSLFVSPDVREVFSERLASYKLTKSAIKFPLDESVPVKLVTEIVKYAAKNNLNKALLREAKKKT